jgi:uncharacterized protein
MKTLTELNVIQWGKIVCFYLVICSLTYIVRKFPDVLKGISSHLFDFVPPFNWNHGLAILLTSILFYRIFRQKIETNLLGSKPAKSVCFCLIYIVAYTIIGISNGYEIDKHVWGFIFCSLTIIYNVFEESAWRGYLNDTLGNIRFWIKASITGLLWGTWHLLIFDDFTLWGGFHVFLLLSVIVSFLIGYATLRTKSILVAASVHGLMILRDIHLTLVVMLIWGGFLLLWDHKNLKVPKFMKLKRQLN